MPSELLDWVNTYLADDDEVVVPIKKMWNEWHAVHPQPPLAGFTAQVLADERIEEMGGVEHTEDLDLSPEELTEYEQDMEAMGYFSGPRVKLRSRALMLEHIVRMITKHNDRMEEALRQAREAMPADASEEQEAALMEVMAQAEQLRRSLREAGLEADDEQGEGPRL